MTHARWTTLLFLIVALAACGDDEELTPVAPTGGTKPGPAKPARFNLRDRLGIEAGMILYKQTGKVAGDIRIWWQDHGETVVHLEVTERGRMKTHQKTIWRDGMTTLYDYETGTKSTHKIRPKVTELPWNALVKEADLERVGIKKVGTETLLGLECTIWDQAALKIKTWVHKHLVVREENGLGGYVRTAVEFEPIKRISEDAFAVPGS